MSGPRDPLADQPLLRRLHDDHPDVDIVLLPARPQATGAEAAEDAPLPPDDPGATEGERAETARLLDGFCEVVVATFASDGMPAADEPVLRHGWRSGDRPGTVRPVDHARVPMPDVAAGVRLGRTMSRVLHEQGWLARVGQTTPVVQVHADRGGRHLRMVWTDDTVVLTLSGRSVPTTPRTARRLLTGAEDGRG